MTHVVNTSGGIGSYITGKRVESQFPGQVEYLFADTRFEDADLYRFLIESVSALTGISDVSDLLSLCREIPDDLDGSEETQKARVDAIARIQKATKKRVPLLKWIADGRTIWEVFRDAKYLGNSRVDVCSQVLKRQKCRDWIESNFLPDQCILYLGIDASETHRFTEEIRNRWLPYTIESPLVHDASYTKKDMLLECERDGIDPPVIYDEGFPHNNCRGMCVKAGQAHYLHVLKVRPALFRLVEQKEQEMRDQLGNVAMMVEEKKGVKIPLPLSRFRLEVLSGERKVNPRDYGSACKCFSGGA